MKNFINKQVIIASLLLLTSAKAFADDAATITLTIQNNTNAPVALMPMTVPDQGLGTWKDNAFFKGYIRKGATSDTETAASLAAVQMGVAGFVGVPISAAPCGMIAIMMKIPGLPIFATAMTTNNNNDASCKIDSKLNGNNFVVNLTIAPSTEKNAQQKINPNAG